VRGGFTEPQVQIVLLIDAVTNACTWAVAFHTALGLKEGIDLVDLQAIREGRLPKDGQLAALSALARTMIEKRGRLSHQNIDRFMVAGFGRDHAPEVVAIVAASTITNYAGGMTTTPSEAAFQVHAWRGEKANWKTRSDQSENARAHRQHERRRRLIERHGRRIGVSV
jgi:AhpD family alkylhydroperoxidase